MKIILSILISLLTLVGYGQIPDNKRSSYIEVSKDLPFQKSKLTAQNSSYKDPIIKEPSQDTLIRQLKVKTKKYIYTDDWSIEYYDERGLKTKYETLDEGSLTAETFSYELDSKGNVIKIVEVDSEGETLVRHFQFDDKNRLIAKSYAREGSDPSFTNMYYNDDLNVMLEVSKYGVDKSYFDDRGLRVIFESFDEDNKLVGWAKSTYNRKGFKISEESTVMGLKLKDVYSYNEKGQLLNAERTSSMVNASWGKSYNEKGLITMSRNKSHVADFKTLFEYTFYE